MGQDKPQLKYKVKGSRKQIQLLNDYFKDTFNKIDRADYVFCTTLMNKKLKDRFAKSLILGSPKLDHVLDEEGDRAEETA